jgi:hypothetical protein
MSDYVGKNITSNKPRCLIALKRSNYDPWIDILQEKTRGKDGW